MIIERDLLETNIKPTKFRQFDRIITHLQEEKKIQDFFSCHFTKIINKYQRKKVFKIVQSDYLFVVEFQEKP